MTEIKESISSSHQSHHAATGRPTNTSSSFICLARQFKRHSMPFPSHLDRADCGSKGEDQTGRGDAAASQGGHLLPLAPGHNPRGIAAIQLPLCKILVSSLFQTTRAEKPLVEKCRLTVSHLRTDGHILSNLSFICLEVYIEV